MRRCAGWGQGHLCCPVDDDLLDQVVVQISASSPAETDHGCVAFVEQGGQRRSDGRVPTRHIGRRHAARP